MLAVAFEARANLAGKCHVTPLAHCTALQEVSRDWSRVDCSDLRSHAGPLRRCVMVAVLRSMQLLAENGKQILSGMTSAGIKLREGG